MARRRLPPPFAVSDLPVEDPAALRGFVRPPVARVAAESAAEAALRSLSLEMQSLRDQGRMVVSLPPGAIEENHLLRDRLMSDPEDFAALKTSIRAHGQRTPIEVCELAPGRYGLISGWRRLHALRDLALEEPGRFAEVLALVRSPESAAEAYIAMVEENEIRVGLSYWERAAIALRAARAGVFADERAALRQLFSGASRARRSKIGSFMSLVEDLDGVVQFPAALPERLGLALAAALAQEAGRGADWRQRLAALPAALSAEEEQNRLQDLLSAGAGRMPAAAPKPKAVRQELRPGLWMEARGGRLVLGGAALSPDLIARLTDLLRSETDAA
ncbi:ParB/RepB/Spo0J family partition protein [Falsigemmobacter faecalis]|uniref:ParB-like N-terminal domain-containing protein n=1 Tax=Falsigemmobacter faecalis TaxID=2488730 RepID=A0A3P3D9Y6_9RHOB|nr:ParB N-terminal domain-containing protein [Falsigemmobacter faecalis]RRH71169.1 hypothetical protein EG244_16685 [Falsigemmobacter faecalis]